MTKVREGEIPVRKGQLSVCRPIRIGCAGWNLPRLQFDRFVSRVSHLERYSRVFNCCEINSSFYRPHKMRTWERWSKTVPAAFSFSVKAPRMITHEFRLDCGSSVLSPFLQQISYLRGKLGPLLFQLPPSLEFDYPVARRFLAMLREDYAGEVVCEPRHVSWFTGRADDLLEQFEIARAATDPACVPAAAHPGGHQKLAYFRLHGSPRIYYSDYAPEFLNTLAVDLKNLPANVSVWCVFDNTASGCAIKNALQLTTEIQEACIPEAGSAREQ